MSGEAPDIREQEDCPSAKACDGRCDQHETPDSTTPPTPGSIEAAEIVVQYVETAYDRVAQDLDDGTHVVHGLPYRAEYDGLQAAATSPEGARAMIQQMIERRVIPHLSADRDALAAEVERPDAGTPLWVAQQQRDEARAALAKANETIDAVVQRAYGDGWKDRDNEVSYDPSYSTRHASASES